MLLPSGWAGVQMTVSVIVPNLNGIEMLRRCLISLLNHDRVPDQIVVVDNGSSDGSPGIIETEFPEVKLISLEHNTGFTGANNAGLKSATEEFLILLNNDCIVEPGWLDALTVRMEDPSIAAITSSMRNIEDMGIMDSAGGEIDWMGFSRDTGKGEPASDHASRRDVCFPCGGAVMIRRRALPDSSRLFWEELFAYEEDFDLGLELLRTGWKIVYEPHAIVRHVHSATSVRGSFFKEYFCVRNRLLVLRKHFDVQTFRKLWPYIILWQKMWIMLSLLRGRFTLARAIFKGTMDGLGMPVEFFEAEISVRDVFSRFAKTDSTVGLVKRNIYGRVRDIILH